METIHTDIVLALQKMKKEEALYWAKVFSGKVWGFKVNDLLIKHGVSIIHELKEFGSVFADVKLHDTPGSAANSMDSLAQAGADIVTVHASGGMEMMTAARQAAGESRVLAVTVLSSLNDRDVRGIYNQPVRVVVCRFAKNALRIDLDGIVCAQWELEFIRSFCEFKNIFIATPGIRPEWYQKDTDDQYRVMTPFEAVELGSNMLVIGRPVFDNTEPEEAFNRIMGDIKSAA